MFQFASCFLHHKVAHITNQRTATRWDDVIAFTARHCAVDSFAVRMPPCFAEVVMGLDLVTAGNQAPDIFNVIIEIPMNADPIKYEVDKETGAIFVDRFMGTAMHYPCNYGYVPRTIAQDGDPVDVLVITPFPLIPGVVVRCRPLGLLKMTDEAGADSKVLAVPDDQVLPIYSHWHKHEDINPQRLAQIQHFFEHYKDLEPGKWVRIDGWGGVDDAKREIATGMTLYGR
jgi:inorganic pyrophosphatase